MNRSILNKIISKVEKEEEIFADKSMLSTLSLPEKIVGRKKQAEELVRFLVGYKKGFVPPLISVYGRSGSGKTTITKFVCEHFDDISCCYVNLRKARTIFSVANLILEELGQEQVKSPQGLNTSVNKIAEGIVSKLKNENKNVLVLLLDEVDVIFNDKRGKPSDFFYKLVVLEEKLKQQNYLVSIITVSNQLIGDYDLDERVRSRICNSEIYFEPYTKNEILRILGDRIKKAFSKELNDSIIERAAQLSADEHGDARRAIDLLRVAAQFAASKNEELSIRHVNLAIDELQKDKITQFLSTASFYVKLICLCLARLTYDENKGWHATSSIYKQYLGYARGERKSLSYRRISELLIDLENSGIVISHKFYKERGGFGREYKLTVSPEFVGATSLKEYWDVFLQDKKEYDEIMKLNKI